MRQTDTLDGVGQRVKLGMAYIKEMVDFRREQMRFA